MNCFLKEVSLTDGTDIYYMLREIGPGENGFLNDGNIEFSGFPGFSEKGIYKVLMTTTEDNTLSRKVIEGNGGLLSHIYDGQCYYWISI